MGSNATFIARDPRSIEFFERVRRAATTDSTVLVQGETGTGKGLVARLLHDWSRRAQRRLVTVACGAIPDSLLESELFGHERGSFTGAQGRRVGRFELADRGTLFLDEIENAPLSMQVDLLRVLQERCIERVGGTETIEVDVRLVAATNRDLAQMVEAGRFREDLLFRLGVLVLDVPPLRERRLDLVPLAEHFLARLASRRGAGPTRLGPEARRDLLEHDWPGNVRELEHTIERSAVFETGAELERLAFFDARARSPLAPAHPAAGEPACIAGTLEDARRAALEDLDVRYLRGLLARFRGDVRRASAHAGLSRRGLYYLIDKYDLDASAFRDGAPVEPASAPRAAPRAPSTARRAIAGDPGVIADTSHVIADKADVMADESDVLAREPVAISAAPTAMATGSDSEGAVKLSVNACSSAAQPSASRADQAAISAWNARGREPSRWHVN